MQIKTILVLIVAAFLLFGCTQSTNTDASTNADAQNNQTNTQPENNQNESTNVDVEVNTEIENPVENTAEVFSNFKSLITGLPEWEISYTITTAGVSIDTIQYVKNDKIRADTTAQGQESRTYLLPTGQYTCTMATGSWMCIDFTEQAGEAMNAGYDDAKANPDKYKSKVTAAGTKTVLGQTTTCFNIKDTDYDYTYCLNAKGAPLHMEGTSGGNPFTYIATAYKESVADSVFTLPAEPGDFELPNIPGYN